MASQCEFTLIDDVIVKIILAVPLVEWPRLKFISKQFDACVRMAYFKLKSFNLKDIILPEFGKYSINASKLETILRWLISNCPGIKTIGGLSCVTGRIALNHLALLENFTKLEHIKLNWFVVGTANISCFFKKISNLKSLEFNRNCWLSDSFDVFEHMSSLTKLTFVDYIDGRYPGNFLQTVNADYLRVLTFNTSKFSGTYVSALLNRCVSLECLYLFDPLTSAKANTIGLEKRVIQCLPNLRKLWKFELDIKLSYGGIAEYSLFDLLNALIKCKTLRTFRLESGNVTLVTDYFLRRLVSECPLLEDLQVSIRRCIYKETISRIANLRNLSTLSIDNMGYSGRLYDLCSNLHQLTKLTDLVIKHLTQSDLLQLSNLKHLISFQYEGNLSELVAQKWIDAGFFSKLKTLKFFDCGGDYYVLIKSISEHAPCLETIFLSSFRDIEELMSIAENCKSLKMIDLTLYNCRMSASNIVKFISTCNSLECLRVNCDESDNLLQPYKHIVNLR